MASVKLIPMKELVVATVLLLCSNHSNNCLQMPQDTWVI